jgi:hypothetical protein
MLNETEKKIELRGRRISKEEDGKRLGGTRKKRNM